MSLKLKDRIFQGAYVFLAAIDGQDSHFGLNIDDDDDDDDNTAADDPIGGWPLQQRRAYSPRLRTTRRPVSRSFQYSKGCGEPEDGLCRRRC